MLRKGKKFSHNSEADPHRCGVGDGEVNTHMRKGIKRHVNLIKFTA